MLVLSGINSYRQYFVLIHGSFKNDIQSLMKEFWSPWQMLVVFHINGFYCISNKIEVAPTCTEEIDIPCRKFIGFFFSSN